MYVLYFSLVLVIVSASVNTENGCKRCSGTVDKVKDTVHLAKAKLTEITAKLCGTGDNCADFKKKAEFIMQLILTRTEKLEANSYCILLGYCEMPNGQYAAQSGLSSEFILAFISLLTNAADTLIKDESVKSMKTFCMVCKSTISPLTDFFRTKVIDLEEKADKICLVLNEELKFQEKPCKDVLYKFVDSMVDGEKVCNTICNLKLGSESGTSINTVHKKYIETHEMSLDKEQEKIMESSGAEKVTTEIEVHGQKVNVFCSLCLTIAEKAPKYKKTLPALLARLLGKIVLETESMNENITAMLTPSVNTLISQYFSHENCTGLPFNACTQQTYDFIQFLKEKNIPYQCDSCRTVASYLHYAFSKPGVDIEFANYFTKQIYSFLSTDFFDSLNIDVYSTMKMLIKKMVGYVTDKGSCDSLVSTSETQHCENPKSGP